MDWECSDVVRFDLGLFLQSQTIIHWLELSFRWIQLCIGLVYNTINIYFRNSGYKNEMITLHFHVVVSPEFHFNPERDQIRMGTDLTHLGDWNERSLILHVKRFGDIFTTCICLFDHLQVVAMVLCVFCNHCNMKRDFLL